MNHPEPASDHLMSVLFVAGDARPAPFFDADIFYPKDPEARSKLGIPSTLQEAVALGAFTRDAIEIDTETGLVYYYPQIYRRDMDQHLRSTQCMLLGPMLIPKDFGSWN